MRLSEKRQQELYAAISEPIMAMRLQYTKAKPLTAEELDIQLFRLESQIWRKVHGVLNLGGHP